MLIQMNHVTKALAGYPLFESADMQINPQAKIGLIGRNGSGKSTLFQLIQGSLAPDKGTISRAKNLRIGEIKQQPAATTLTAIPYMLQDQPDWQRMRQRLTDLEARMVAGDNSDRLLEQYGTALEAFQEQGGYALEDNCLAMLRGLGIEQIRDSPLDQVSGGERARVELAKVLVQQVDVLLLDEPTNHLDTASITWLTHYLQRTNVAYVVISHDRYFLNQVVHGIYELEDGILRYFRGNYQQYHERKADLVAQIQKDYQVQQRERARLERTIRQYRQWGQEGDNDKFFKKAKELERRLAKMTLVQAPVTKTDRLRKPITEAERSGKEVFRLEGVGKAFGSKELFKNVSLTLYRGERLALIGANGSGKTTFLNLLQGISTPDWGIIRQGSAVKIGVLPQKITFDQPEQRVLAYVAAKLGNEQRARAELARFGFYAGDVALRVGDLSGGEKVRLALLLLFQAAVNVLILDEPTNHLDIEAREEIEALLARYHGTLLVVSHDRYFVEKTTEGVLILQGGEIHRA